MMFGLFRKNPVPPQLRDERSWNEDWQVGDLARCIQPFPDRPFARGIARGTLLRVSGLDEGEAIDDPGLLISGLAFEGRPARLFYACIGFRKVRPTQEACDEAFARKLRNALTDKPEKVAA
ncbi:hypothetical protein V5F89_12330 [Pelagerythrobacter marensis]|uniref:PilZ domain-containing protein n=1 Tax=Pelagerythrobacter marensis TaxID=543877 RepID=A0ABZ2D293_9SPHN